ncbi:MAG: ABC transporter permease [Planctomycetaceae bacterium]|jgi:putative ABC transport system ATP-binding protein
MTGGEQELAPVVREQPNPTATRLELRRLTIELGPRQLQLSAPCTLQVGRLYLVSGPSGSGKSSFARALLGFGELADPLIPCAGEITLESGGVTTTLWDAAGYRPESREQMAFLPQAERLGFIDGLSAADNLRLFSHLAPAEARQAAGELSGRFHLGSYPETLARASGGERIRLSAVRGLLPRNRGAGPPPVVLADEPTAGLDPQAARALVRELLELADRRESIVIVITHEPHWFVPESLDQVFPEGAEVPQGVRILECPLETGRARQIREVGSLQFAPRSVPGGWRAWMMQQLERTLQMMGGLILSPLAFVWGLLGIRQPGALGRQVAGDVLSPGTLLFTLTGTVLVAGTVAFFIFEQTPRPELVEPLLLPEILRATGHTLVRVVLPLGACGLVATKLGAAQAARLASAVRSGLLETLALARWRLESFALVPAVLAQVLCMSLATGASLLAGLVMAALVYSAGHAGAPLGLSLNLMLSGVQLAPHWFAFLAAKVVASGFLAGTLAALFGHAPATSEQDVARAVHRALLWGVLAVIACQCLLIIAEFAGDPPQPPSRRDLLMTPAATSDR